MVILQQNFMPLQSDINTNKNSMALFYKFTALECVYQTVSRVEECLGCASNGFSKNKIERRY